MSGERAAAWRPRATKLVLASTISRACNLPVIAALTKVQRQPLILGYHRVVPDFAVTARTEMPNMLISVSTFERHLDWLAGEFRFASLDEIGEHAARGVPFAEPVVAITFDDGYRDVYDYAYPALRRRGIPAAVFIVTDFVGQPLAHLHDTLYYRMTRAFNRWTDPRGELVGLLAGLNVAPSLLKARATTESPLSAVAALVPTLPRADVARLITGLDAAVGSDLHETPQSVTWPMVKDMRRAGFTIGSHTRTHVSLPVEATDAIAAEVEGSKHELERQLGEPIEHFAFPGGLFTPRVVDAVVRAGYRFGYTACRHGDPRHPAMTMTRLLLSERSSVDTAGHFSPDILNCQTHDLWPPARRCDRRHHA